MGAWSKGRAFVSMIERKQQSLQHDILKMEFSLLEIRQSISECEQEYENISLKIKMLVPEGVICRDEIYKRLRKQGTLLSEQQLLLHKIDQLGEKENELVHNRELKHAAMSILDRKHYKITSHLQRTRKKYLQRCDNDAENEIQEMAVHAGKNI
ncbi:type III secretion system protein [Enterobacter cloacae]|uniref:type III secretion system protein n=1 Tax=Enterobacter cloacae TaxID=550 RepID=UPI002FF482F3